VQVAPGDVTDAAAVARALEGVQAVIHAAAVFSLNPARRDEMWRTNVQGTEIVLGAAAAAGCDPIIHVSSVVALFPMARQPSLDPPIGHCRTPYAVSKTGAERFARALQASGKPVVTTYPGTVWGADDPAAGELVQNLRGFLGNRFPFLTTHTGLCLADVGWVARAHAALVEPGKGPRTITLGGHYVSLADLHRALRRVTGRRLPRVLPSPKPLSWLFGWTADRLSALFKRPLVYSVERIMSAYWSGPTDDSRAIALVGPPPPVDDTLRRAVVWAAGAGHLPEKWAGRALTAPAARAQVSGGERAGG
jgi:dihydroflavonol-4-reductase